MLGDSECSLSACPQTIANMLPRGTLGLQINFSGQMADMDSAVKDHSIGIYLNEERLADLF